MHVIYLVRRGRKYHTDQSHRILLTQLFYVKEGRHSDLSPLAVQWVTIYAAIRDCRLPFLCTSSGRFWVFLLLVFELGLRTGQTDRHTDGRARPAMWPVGRPHTRAAQRF